MKLSQRFIGHLKTITRHRHQVIRHCAKAGILWQGLFHDLSKYSPTEFWPGVKYFDGTHSPTQDERKELGYSAAWMHHKGRNKHHWEYWIDIDVQKKQYAAIPMPRKYVGEMICDRVAASKIYNGSAYRDSDPLAYFQRGKTSEQMNSETKAILEQFLTRLADEGEDAMFRSLREWIRAGS